MSTSLLRRAVLPLYYALKREAGVKLEAHRVYSPLCRSERLRRAVRAATWRVKTATPDVCLYCLPDKTIKPTLQVDNDPICLGHVRHARRAARDLLEGGLLLADTDEDFEYLDNWPDP